MTTHRIVKRILITFTALSSGTLVPAAALAANIPTGAPRSPLLNGATPFSQKLAPVRGIRAAAAAGDELGRAPAGARRLQRFAGQQRAR